MTASACGALSATGEIVTDNPVSEAGRMGPLSSCPQKWQNSVRKFGVARVSSQRTDLDIERSEFGVGIARHHYCPFDVRGDGSNGAIHIQLIVVLIVGAGLSVVGLLVAKRTDSRLPRRLGILVNASTLGLHSIIAVGFLAFVISLLVNSKRERFVIPAGYMGDVYVLYNAADGEPARQSHGETLFRIPRDGVLRLVGPVSQGPTRTTYFYEHDDGSLEKIDNLLRRPRI